MHSRLKVRTTEEQQAIKLKEQQEKLKQYQGALKKIFALRQLNKTDDSLLPLTEHVLLHNPDVATLWNIRREVLLKNDDELVLQECVKKELALTEACLKVNPKSYFAWHHRRWILLHCPEPDWQQEILLCKKYLNYDERNFHCWDYRNSVVPFCNRTEEEELEFSTEKIHQNFSNYSAWHYRSKLYKCLMPDSDVYLNELELVQNAIFTDPDDTSAWFYQRWLLGKRESNLKFVIGHWTDGVLNVTFNKNVSLNDTQGDYKLLVNNATVKSDVLGGVKQFSQFYRVHLPSVDGDLELKIVNKTGETVDLLTLKFDNSTKTAKGETKEGVNTYFSEEIRGNLEEQLSSFQELLTLEPNNKWAQLTIAIIKRGFNDEKYAAESIKDVELLIEWDTKRRGFYEDLRSKWLIENELSTILKSETRSLFDEIHLENLGLTAMYYLPYFVGCKKISLKGNQLSDLVKEQIGLILGGNVIYS